MPPEHLEVLRVGSGPPLLLLHGPTPYAAELPFIHRLGQHFEVIAPSHPGFGNSPRADDFDSVYDLVRLYLDFLEEFDRVTLLGASFGGWLATEIAVCAPRSLQQLILVDSVGIKLGDRSTRDILHLFNTPPAELDRCAWHDPQHRPHGPHGLGWQRHLESYTDDELVLLARAWDALCLYAWKPHLYNPHLARWLHRIQVPTLVLWGSSDGIVSPDYGCAFAARIRNSEFHIIDAAGHHPELEQPEFVVQHVRTFIQ